MHIPVLAAVAVGGAAGALGRHGVAVLLGGGPASTLAVNLSGCLLIGALTVVTDPAGLLRPLFGTGVLGGYTTFSGYALDVHGLVAGGRPLVAAMYLVGTVAGALAAVWLGSRLSERRPRWLRWRRPRRAAG